MLKPSLVALLLVSAFPFAAEAQDARADRAITVVGEGETAAAPDIAIVTSGVVSRAPTAGAALKANAAAMTKVIATLKDAKVEERDYATAGLSVQPQYDYGDNNSGQRPPKLVGYEVRNTVTIRARYVGKLGELVDALVGAGSNEIEGLAFDVSDRTAKLDEARKEAIADARRKAELYAASAGVKLGAPISIDEQEAPGEQPVRPFAARAKMADAAATPIARGERQLRARVSVRWAIEP